MLKVIFQKSFERSLIHTILISEAELKMQSILDFLSNILYK